MNYFMIYLASQAIIIFSLLRKTKVPRSLYILIGGLHLLTALLWNKADSFAIVLFYISGVIWMLYGVSALVKGTKNA